MSSKPEFSQKLAAILSHSALSFSINFGLRLGIFDALASFSEERPASSEDIAGKLKLKPNYVFDLLSGLACGEIVEVDPSGQKFWIPEDRKEALSGAKDPTLVMIMMNEKLGQEFENILKCIKKDGPQAHNFFHDHSHHNPMFQMMGESKHAMIKKYFDSDYLPKLGMNERLHQGIDVLDVGCGPGMQIVELAQRFPKSRFIGFDVSEGSIATALKEQAAKQLKNVEFLTMDAKEFKSEWANKFELVISFDSFHHHNHPKQALKEVFRVLKPGGLFALVEIEGTNDNAYVDRERGVITACINNMGLFMRKPEDDSKTETISMFALWGVQRATKLLEEVGFKDIKVEKVKSFDFNVLFLARKP